MKWAPRVVINKVKLLVIEWLSSVACVIANDSIAGPVQTGIGRFCIDDRALWISKSELAADVAAKQQVFGEYIACIIPCHGGVAAEYHIAVGAGQSGISAKAGCASIAPRCPGIDRAE